MIYPGTKEFNEATVIGSAVMSEGVFMNVRDVVNVGCFSHGVIWDAIERINDEGKPVNLINVYAKLPPEEINWLIEAVNYGHASDDLVLSAALQLRQEFLKMETFKTLQKYNLRLMDGDPLTVVSDLIENLTALNTISYKQTKTIRDDALLLAETLGVEEVGVMTGLHSLDNFTGGWKGGELIILGGNPGMGKTALAMAFTLGASCPVGFISLEMPKVQLLQRIAAVRSGVPIKSLKYHLDRVKAELREIAELPLYIEDGIYELRSIAAACYRLVKEHGVGLIIIDYLQLIHHSTNRSREQEVSQISASIKRMARELNVPVIALSQLSRANTQHPDKRPKLSDLRDSGSLEQDADIVLFPFRPEYFNLKDDDGNTFEGLMELHIAKGRQIGTGHIKLEFDGPTTQIKEQSIF